MHSPKHVVVKIDSSPPGCNLTPKSNVRAKLFLGKRDLSNLQAFNFFSVRIYVNYIISLFLKKNIAGRYKSIR
jgi:hypothetical protein